MKKVLYFKNLDKPNEVITSDMKLNPFSMILQVLHEINQFS